MVLYVQMSTLKTRSKDLNPLKLKKQMVQSTPLVKAVLFGQKCEIHFCSPKHLGYVQNRKVESQYTGITEVSKQEKSWSGSKASK